MHDHQFITKSIVKKQQNLSAIQQNLGVKGVERTVIQKIYKRFRTNVSQNHKSLKDQFKTISLDQRIEEIIM